MRQIVLDTETTGREPELGHRIIEIGAIVIQSREITDEIFHSYINPQRDSDPEALAVHGLSQDFLQDKPLFSDILEKFLQFLTRNSKTDEVIIHNAKFDTAFFNAEIDKYNASHQNGHSSQTQRYQPLQHYCSIVDSLKLARALHPNQRNSLDALCKRYLVDHSKRNWHGALLDAELLAQVYLRMTAGQSSFFDVLNIAPQSTQSTHEAKPYILFDLPVHLASATELQAHAHQLAMMRQATGFCLWEDE